MAAGLALAAAAPATAIPAAAASSAQSLSARSPSVESPSVESPWADGLEGRLRLVGGGGAGESRWLGLTMELEPGWKIFWRAPGAPGLPPVLDWQGSRNLKSARIVWPAPEIFTSFGFKARGFGGRFTLPIRATVRDADSPLKARVLVLYQLCKDVCIPVEAKLALDVPPQAAAHPEIVAARALVPRPAGEGFAVWRAERRGRGLTVRLRHRSRIFPQPVILVEAPKRVRLGRTGPVLAGADGGIGVSIPILGKRPVPKDFRVQITLIAGPDAWERSVPVSAAVER